MKNNKQYLPIASIIFTVLAIAHLARIVLMLDITIAGAVIPLWVRGAAVVVAGHLGTQGFVEAHKI